MIDGVEVSVTTSKIISDDEKKDEEMRFLRYVDDFVCLQDTVSIKTIGARLVLCVCVCVCVCVKVFVSHHLVIVFLGEMVCFQSQLIELSLHCDKWPFGCCFYYTYYFRNPALLVCILLRFEFTIIQRFMEKCLF